jgi:hypothetical protein
MPRCEARRFQQPGDSCKLLEEIVFCMKANHASGPARFQPHQPAEYEVHHKRVEGLPRSPRSLGPEKFKFVPAEDRS